MSPLRFARIDAPLGPMWVAETDLGVAASTRSEEPDSLLAAVGRRFPELEAEAGEVDAAWPEAALTGGPLPSVDLRGLPRFDAAAYEIVRAIPPGTTLTYGDVAVLAGSPGAARAVGNAMARCPLFLAVPCHRVVRASDGWSGWGGDPAFKRRLLAAERRPAQ